MSDPAKQAKADRFTKQWHYRPDVPLTTSPLFEWPLRPARVARWFAARWFVIGENLIITALACLTWWFFSPSLEQAAQLEFSWVAGIFLRNLVLMTLVAGGLHLFFYTFAKQDKELKFDPKDLGAKARVFTLGSQLKDNMFWTLTSGVFFWTAFEAMMLWGMGNGYVPVAWFSDNPLWIIVLLVLTPLWISFHFYWIHRLLHWPPLYKRVHSLHHRNTNIGPWSGLSMHPVEHLLFFSSVLIHWILAAHPVVILFHLQHQALTAATSHTGFDAWLIKDKRALELGNFHHQMHHKYFECNYGSLEVPWDKYFGSFHDGTPESHEEFVERRKAMTE